MGCGLVVRLAQGSAHLEVREQSTVDLSALCAEIEGVRPTAMGVHVCVRSLQRALRFLRHGN
jgi:hypothetical protein